MTKLKRRHFLLGLAAFGSQRVLGFPVNDKLKSTIVIIGGGFSGATCAKYLKKLAPQLNVILIEANYNYTTCPMSNSVIAGLRKSDELSQNYQRLQSRYAIEIIHDQVINIDTVKQRIILKSHKSLNYDSAVVAPGIDFKWNALEGYDETTSQFIPHAWKAGQQTLLLKQQLHALKNGENCVISVPLAPFRCPPGPYERASLIAHYFKQHKPRSKIIILDANENFSKQALFQEAWKNLYPGMIEWIPVSAGGKVVRVAGKSKTLYTELDHFQAGVANIIPTQHAGLIASNTGLTDATGWCPINPQTFESTLAKNIYVIGDACQAQPMPKSATSANSQAKICALTIINKLSGKPIIEPKLINVCYSLISPEYGISVSGVYEVQNKELVTVKDAGGTSPADKDAAYRLNEAAYAEDWYQGITYDTFR